MGRVEAFELSGMDCWFPSQDHRPPHFHAKRRGEWEVRVFFLNDRTQMVERKQGYRGRIKAGDLKSIYEVSERFREELLLEWERKVVC